MKRTISNRREPLSFAPEFRPHVLRLIENFAGYSIDGSTTDLTWVRVGEVSRKVHPHNTMRDIVVVTIPLSTVEQQPKLWGCL